MHLSGCLSVFVFLLRHESNPCLSRGHGLWVCTSGLAHWGFLPSVSQSDVMHLASVLRLLSSVRLIEPWASCSIAMGCKLPCWDNRPNPAVLSQSPFPLIGFQPCANKVLVFLCVMGLVCLVKRMQMTGQRGLIYSELVSGQTIRHWL